MKIYIGPIKGLKILESLYPMGRVYELRCWLQHPASLDGAVEQLSLVLVKCDFKHYFKIRLLLYKYFAQAQGVI